MANITPFQKLSTNISFTLKEAAADRDISVKELDFDLLQVETLVKSPEYKEWTLIDEKLEKLFEKKLLCSPLVELRQEYVIRIRAFKENPVFKKVKIEFQTNKTKSKSIAIFKKGSIFPKVDKLATRIRNEIYKQKIQRGYIVRHYEPELNDDIVKMVKILKPNTPLEKDINITICTATPPVLQTDGRAIFHYENKQKKDHSLIAGVNPEELVFEYIKPQKGHDGRGCNGQYIAVLEPKTSNTQYAPDPETIRISEDEKSIKYYAKIDGYGKNEHGVIKISQEISLKTVSFKGTGSINTDESQDISLNITNKKSDDDAVGSGVNIDIKEVNINGTVGANASVKAVELSVGEQTHRNSQLQAVEHADVNLHRGKLKAKTATINILENGTVEAQEEVHVKKMLGGEIIAPKVYVEELSSNATIIALELIEVGYITGDHNKLIIDPHKIDAHHQKIKALQETIKSLETSLKEFQKQYTEKVSKHKDLLPRIKTFQKRVLAASQAGKTPNKADMIRIKQYKRDSQQLKEDSKYLAQKEKNLNIKQEELQKTNEPEMFAKVVCKSAYDGHTQVQFIDSKTKEKYFMLPNGEYETLHLEKDDDTKKIVC